MFGVTLTDNFQYQILTILLTKIKGKMSTLMINPHKPKQTKNMEASESNHLIFFLPQSTKCTFQEKVIYMTNQSWNRHFILYIDMFQNLQLNKMCVCVLTVQDQ